MPITMTITEQQRRLIYEALMYVPLNGDRLADLCEFADAHPEIGLLAPDPELDS